MNDELTRLGVRLTIGIIATTIILYLAILLGKSLEKKK